MFKFLAGFTIGSLSIYSIIMTGTNLAAIRRIVDLKKEKEPDEDTLEDTWAYLMDKLNINN